jgi:hypothetical protein
MLGEQFREVLYEAKKRFIDFVERPSKYMPEPKEPLCLERTTKFFKQDPINKPFGNSTHTSWEAFQHTMKTDAYQTVLSGNAFKKFTNSAGRFTTGMLPPVVKNSFSRDASSPPPK